MEEKLADQIRNYCYTNYIIPARKNNQEDINIVVGQIHSEMNLKNRVPAVCSALQAKKFEIIANVKKISVEGPHQGMNTTITFKIL